MAKMNTYQKHTIHPEIVNLYKKCFTEKKIFVIDLLVKESTHVQAYLLFQYNMTPVKITQMNILIRDFLKRYSKCYLAYDQLQYTSK